MANTTRLSLVAPRDSGNSAVLPCAARVELLHWRVPVATICVDGHLALPRAEKAQFIDELFYSYWFSGALLRVDPSPRRRTINARLRREIADYHSDRCVYCDQQRERLTLDHIVPVSFGGTDHHSNFHPACGDCNTSHYQKTFARARYVGTARLVAGLWKVVG